MLHLPVLLVVAALAHAPCRSSAGTPTARLCPGGDTTCAWWTWLCCTAGTGAAAPAAAARGPAVQRLRSCSTTWHHRRLVLLPLSLRLFFLCRFPPPLASLPARFVTLCFEEAGAAHPALAAHRVPLPACALESPRAVAAALQALHSHRWQLPTMPVGVTSASVAQPLA